jgi:DNA-binding CsgD family transcriptional regulator
MGARVTTVRQDRLVGFLEALYRWDTSDEEWLLGLCAPLMDMVDGGLWVQANTYDASDASGSGLRLPAVVTHRAPPIIKEQFLAASKHWSRDLIVRCYYGSAVSTQPSGPEVIQRETGAGGAVSVKGLDPSGCSAALNVGVPDLLPLSADALTVLRKISGHLTTAARVRRRIAEAAATNAPVPSAASPAEGADAVFSPEHNGHLVHAEAPATGRRERASLLDAVRAREAARTARGADRSLDSWRPLVDARWTLVDAYESNGTRYIVARENQADARSLDDLSERERQVVVCLAFGQTTKEIAYGLGIDASTVRVLLQRAAAKLHVDGRAGLLDHPSVKALRGGMDYAEVDRLRGAVGASR